MPFSSNGTYTPATGATNAAPGQVLQSAVWDAIFTDLSNALTQVQQEVINGPGFINLMAPNGGLNVWQRAGGTGPSFSVNASTTQYTADRWYITTGASQASTVSAIAGLDSMAQTNHGAKIARNNSQTGSTQMLFAYPFDTDEVGRMRGNKVSFYCLLKAGTTFSPTSGNVSIDFYVGTGTAGKRGGGFAGETHVFSTLAALTPGGSVQTVTLTSANTIPTTSTQGELQITWTPTGTAGSDDSLSIDDFALVNGTVVYQYADVPFEIGVNMCKRHFYKSFPYATTPAQASGTGTGELYATQVTGSAGTNFIFYRSAISMRATPGTVTTYSPASSNATIRDETTSADYASTTTSAATSEGVIISGTSPTGSSAGNLISVHLTMDAGL